MLLGGLESLLLVPIATGVAGFVYLGLVQAKNARRYTESGCNIPYVKERLFVGSMKTDRPFREQMASVNHIGPVAYQTYFGLPVITVSDPDIVQYVLSMKNLPKGVLIRSGANYLGRNLINMQHGEGNPWKKERRLADPAFRVSSLRGLVEVFGQHSVAFTKNLKSLSESKKGEPFDFAHEIYKVTLDIISSAGFGFPMHESDELRTRSPFLIALNKVFVGVNSLAAFFPFGYSILRWWQSRTWQTVNDVFYSVIDERMDELKKGKTSNRIPDLLDLLLRPDEMGETLSREQLRNELLLFYIAGHETVATTLAWCLHEICTHPEVYEALMAEIETVLGPNDGEIRAPTADQVNELVYTKMVLNETLRLHPPVPGIPGREIPETFEIKGYIFPKGFQITCAPLSTHYDEKYWPNPTVFDPQRFSKKNSEGRHLYSFYPFGAGPRICVGKNFFYLEAPVVLATLLRTLKFELSPNHESGKRAFVGPILRPNAVWVIPSQR